jgi:hypothetical protein
MTDSFLRSIRNARRRDYRRLEKNRRIYDKLPVDPETDTKYTEGKFTRTYYRADVTRYAYKCIYCGVAWKVYQQEVHGYKPGTKEPCDAPELRKAWFAGAAQRKRDKVNARRRELYAMKKAKNEIIHP